jgi:hypothetical protein
MFPMRYELNCYVLFRRNPVLKELIYSFLFVSSPAYASFLLRIEDAAVSSRPQYKIRTVDRCYGTTRNKYYSGPHSNT